MGGASFPFLLYREGLESISLAVAVSLSLILVLGYLVLYSVQVLPSFVSSGSFGALALLPIDPRETSVVAAMTLWRTLDSILVLSLLTQLAMVAYFTGSAVATVLMLAASVSGSVLAVALALWMTSLFQRKLEGGSLSGARAFFRPLFFVVWGLGVMSVVFLFSLISFVAPTLDSLLASPGGPTALVFPFSAGILVSRLAGQGPYAAATLAYGGVTIAAAGAVLAAVGTSRMINGVVLPSRNLLARASGRGFGFRVRGPLSAYILKDIRVSSRNPATGFLFALPLFEILAVVLPLTATTVVRMSALLVGAQVGAGFALFTAFLLVTVEDFGVERRTALPFSESVRTLSKVAVSTVTYVPVTLTLLAVVLTKRSTFGGSVAVPLATLCSVFAACVVEVFVLRVLAERRTGNVGRFAAGVGSGEAVTLTPALAYAAVFILSGSHWLALETLAVVVAAELLGSFALLRVSGNPARSS